MRFGGHETFPIRDGWLHKGLRLLIEDPDLLIHEFAADYLGVGRNMAKSIRHWLVATGLGAVAHGKKIGRLTSLCPTDFGKLLWRRDQFFLEHGTWWALHVNLVNASNFAASWSWFFNSFHLERFDRAVCIESLMRHLQVSGGRVPARRTLERDIACLLSTYARTIPAQSEDPEEALDCPLRELGLMTHYKHSGYYHLDQSPKPIPPAILGYSLRQAFSGGGTGGPTLDIPLYDATQRPGAPGRVFSLTSESLFEVALKAETQRGPTDVEIAGHAGERVLRIRRKKPLEWLGSYYEQLEQERNNAA